MAEGSRGRGILGRFLVALGLVWVFWGFLGPAVGLEFGNTSFDLPILPGFVILFIGRALARRSGRGEIGSRQGSPAESRIPPRPEPQVKRAPVPDRSVRESMPVVEPVAISDVIVEAFEVAEPELAALDEVPMRKTSAEMVAEARKRFGRRP